MDNYKAIENKLANFQDFEGNSMSGSRHAGIYSVWSYGTLIADYKFGTLDDGEPRIKFNATKFSTTTSRHQNLIRKVWNIS